MNEFNTDGTKQWQEEAALNRFRLISPLLDDSLDPAKKIRLRESIAEQNGISVRSLYRYEKAYEDGGFAGLKPVNREMRRSAALPENFDELVAEAVQLKREVPSRSVNQIIMILELEGRVLPGILKRSTLQRHLYQAGFGKKQMKRYAEARKSSSRRYCKPHRMQLTEAYIKYGPKLPIGRNGAKVQTYLSVVMDQHSRLVLASGFYATQDAYIVEETYRKAILKHGKMDAALNDNGKQYVSRQLANSLATLGIRVKYAKPYSPQTKGGVEVFNRFVNAFLAECRAQKVRTLEELNQWWDIWLESYYHQKPHEGISEYYTSLGCPERGEGITPLQEWNRDTRPLTFLDVSVVTEAFLHHEQRTVDNSGCFSFRGRKYEAGATLAGKRVSIAYDPMAPERVTVSSEGICSFEAVPLVIGENCGPKPALPDHMLPETPESSRFLEVLREKNRKEKQAQADAISFGSYRKDGGFHV
ncbi:MAG: DDE-type integrase/transposase/recombinase [Lachnospiraceae bacterium]